RLVCRLSHPTPERRRAMTREPLADRPDVELRFVPGETGEPVLAEIAFPAGTAAAEAKAFVARELGEALLRPCGEPERHAAADRITVRWPAADSAGPGEWIDLEPGVREKVVGVGVAAFTAAVTFDPSAGWDAAAAEAWLAAHLPAAPRRLTPRSPFSRPTGRLESPPITLPGGAAMTRLLLAAVAAAVLATGGLHPRLAAADDKPAKAAQKPAKAKKAAGPLIGHMVYFTLKERTPADRERLVAACKKYLAEHDGVVFFSAGVIA